MCAPLCAGLHEGAFFCRAARQRSRQISKGAFCHEHKDKAKHTSPCHPGHAAALAVLLVALIHFPLIPAAPFLEYDPADVPILIGTFLYGPWAGLGLAGVVCIVQGVTVSAGSGPIGILMHFLGTGACVLAAGLIYRRWHTHKGAVGALSASVLVRTAVMCGCNLVFTPLFLGSSMGEVVMLLVPAIIPFNLLYAALNGAVTLVLYKPLSRFLHGVQKRA